MMAQDIKGTISNQMIIKVPYIFVTGISIAWGSGSWQQSLHLN
jgi:hypothetical protein